MTASNPTDRDPLAEALAEALKAVGPGTSSALRCPRPRATDNLRAVEVDQLVDCLMHAASETPRSDLACLAVYCVEAFATKTTLAEAEILRSDLSGPLLRYLLWALARYAVRVEQFGLRKTGPGYADVADAFGLKERRGNPPAYTEAQRLQIVEMFNNKVDAGTTEKEALREVFLAVYRVPHNWKDETHKTQLSALRRLVRNGGTSPAR